MNLIVAVDKEWGIGYKGDLLARVRADLIHFKEVTLGKTVVFGSNTLATFPGGRPLPGRDNIVLHPSSEFTVEGATVAHSLNELFEILKRYDSRDVFIIGGASVYLQLLPFCDKAYITKFDKSFEKDVYIPDLDNNPEWTLSYCGETQVSDPEKDTESGLRFNFNEYVRKT